MKNEYIYGVDLNGEVDPVNVRDAIVNCFFEAHCYDSGVSGGKSEVNKDYCQELVKKAFSDTGGNYDKPDKKSILLALDSLAKFSEVFRKPEIIKHHYSQILKLVNKL